MKKNIARGKIGEKLASDFLCKKGLKIIDKNWRYSRSGEIDIIALDQQDLVFIEVKTRSSNRFGHPAESITEKKLNTMKNLALIYIEEKENIRFKNLRFDAISILLGNKPQIEHYKNID